MMTRNETKKEYFDKILRPHWSAYQQQQQQCQQKKPKSSWRQVTRPIHSSLPILSAQIFRDLFDDDGDDDDDDSKRREEEEEVTKIRNEYDVDGFRNQNTNNSNTSNNNNTTKVQHLKQKKKHLEDKFMTLFERILAGQPEQHQQDWSEEEEEKKRELDAAKCSEANEQENATDTRVRSAHDRKNTDANTDQDQNTTATTTTAATSRCRSSCFSVSSSSSLSAIVYSLPTAHNSLNLEGNMASTRTVIHQQRDTYYQTYHRCRRHNQSMYHPSTIIGSKRNTHTDCRSNICSDEDNDIVPTCIAIHCGFTTNDGQKNDDDDAHGTPSIITDSNGIEKHITNSKSNDTHCSIRGRDTTSDQYLENVRNSSKTAIEDTQGSSSTTIPAVAMETGTATSSVLPTTIPDHTPTSTTRTATTTATRHRWNCCDFLPLVPN